MVADDDLHADFVRLYQVLRRRFDQTMIENGMSHSRVKMLWSIQEEAGTMRAADLAERFLLAPRTVTEALDLLERDGLIARVPDTVDRRVKRLEVTAEGRAMLAVVEPLRKQLTTELFSALDEQDRAHLHAALGKLLQSYNER